MQYLRGLGFQKVSCHESKLALDGAIALVYQYKYIGSAEELEV
jgi:hypothetical protein